MSMGLAKRYQGEWELGGGNVPMVLEKDMSKTIVRRLTPTECERLQGYPDDWTVIGEQVAEVEKVDAFGNKYMEPVYEYIDRNGKKKKLADSARYKALGNSIAIPQWYWIFQKMKPFLKEVATLGSLFDGIGGFPLAWENIHGKGSAVWASEIEDFPIEVTRRRFPDD